MIVQEASLRDSSWARQQPLGQISWKSTLRLLIYLNHSHNFQTTWTKNQGITKVSRVHPLGTIFVHNFIAINELLRFEHSGGPWCMVFMCVIVPNLAPHFKRGNIHPQIQMSTKTLYGFCSEKSKSMEMPWQQHWLTSTVAACFPCGLGVFCSRVWSTAVFNDKKLEHILSFRQNIAVIIRTLLFCYVKQAIPVWGAVILLMLFIKIDCIILFFSKIQWNRACIDHTEQHSGGPYSSLCAIGQHSCMLHRRVCRRLLKANRFSWYSFNH